MNTTPNRTLLIFFSLVLNISLINAQKSFVSVSTNQLPCKGKNVTDTLQPLGFAGGNVSLDSALIGGYVCGTNAYNDKAKAQLYFIDDSSSYFVNGCGLYIGSLILTDTTKSLKLVLYDLWGYGINNEGPIVKGAPGNIIESIDIPVTALQQNQVNYIMFPYDVWVTGSYALGIDFSLFGDNTIGLMASPQGSADSTELAWEQIEDGTWYSMFTTWPFDADMGIFAVIDDATAGISTKQNTSGYTITIFPNPVRTNQINISIYSDKKVSSDVSIINSLGQNLYTFEQDLNKGANDFEVQIPSLVPGEYFIRFNILKSSYIKNILIL